MTPFILNTTSTTGQQLSVSFSPNHRARLLCHWCL